MDRTVASLERKQNLRLLICVVEEWGTHGDVTTASLLAQVRALMDLRDSDRAWARLLPLLEAPENAEVYHLAGQILVDQGRIAEAVILLQGGLARYPKHGDLLRQLSRTEQAATQIDRTDPVGNRHDGLVRLAELHLSRGAHLRARAVLERVLKEEPGHPRATDLTWVLEGDFRLKGVRLRDLVRVHAGPTRVSDLAVFDGDDEHTEAAGLHHQRLLDEPAARAPGFPTLFKNLDPQPTFDDETESSPEVETTEFARVLDGNPTWSEADAHLDTIIERVVHRSKLPGPDGVDTQVDDPVDVPALHGESEDEDVVVRAGMASCTDSLERTEIEGIQLDPSRDRVPTGSGFQDEGASFLKPRAKARPSDVDTVHLSPIQSRALLANVPMYTPPPVPPRPALEPASLTDDYDLSQFTTAPAIPWTAWLVLGMLIGGGILLVVFLLLVALTSV